MSDLEPFCLDYNSTDYFSNIVADYLSRSNTLRPFYEHLPDLDGIKNAIEARQHFETPRQLLVEVLNEQYKGLQLSAKLEQHIQALADVKCFTITTAHQPNIFTGPLYFIYKILHAVKLAEELALALPQFKFVPVYYMGSEDADLDEIGSLQLEGQPLIWNTKQTGAVGRMKVDKDFIRLINAIEGQIGVLTNGLSLSNIFKEVYTIGKTIQQASLELVNILFAEYGVVVLIPDNAKLKSAYRSVVQKELTQQFSHSIVADTIQALKSNYKVQAAGREINLFYLLNDKRERIELIGENYIVQSLNLTFTQSEILVELEKYPDRFSANVILRGGFQETVLPNIAFIGGGGELAYWLELKEVFHALQIPYPVLVLRNSFLMITQAQKSKMNHLGIGYADLFKVPLTLLNEYVKRHGTDAMHIEHELMAIKTLYQQLTIKATQVDASLQNHVISLEVKAEKRLKELEKKLLRAERLKFETVERQINQLKNSLFPKSSLQERVENFAGPYARFGSKWMDKIYAASTGLNMQFVLIVIDEIK